MVDQSRRGFLKGRPGVSPPLRPPWALPEGEFTQRCSRCGDCVQACPARILVAAQGGYPGVDFSRGQCAFCGDCLSACRTGALVKMEPPWRLAVEISPACLPRQGVECRSCEDACPAAALRFPCRLGGPALPAVDHGHCTGCGACVAPCPAGAISLKPDQGAGTPSFR